VLAAHAGSIVGSARIEVTVSNRPEDRLAPRISVTSPKEGQVVTGTTPIVVQASDDSGIDPFVSIFVDETLRSVSNQAINKYDWDTTEYQNGPHVIDVNAMDETENRSSASVRVIVKNPVKQTSIAAPSVESAAAVRTSVATTAAAESTQTPTASTPTEDTAAKEQEVARTASEPGVEKFEVAQSPETGATAATGSAKPAAAVAQAAPTTPASSFAQPALDAQSSPPAPKPEAAVAAAAEPSEVPADSTAKSAAGGSAKPDLVAKVPETIPVQTTPPKPATETPSLVQVASTPATLPNGVTSELGERPVLMAKSIGTDLVSPAPKNDVRLQTPAVPPVKADRPAAKATEPVSAAPKVARAGLVSKPVEVTTLVVKMDAPKAVEPVANPQKGLGVPVAPRPAEPMARPGMVLMAKAQTTSPDSARAPRPEGTLVTMKPTQVVKAVSRTIGAIVRMIRFRIAFERAGGTVAWHHAEKTVHAVTRTNDVRLKIGSRFAVVNGKRVNMGKAAYIRGGRTMVPISFITEYLGLN